MPICACSGKAIPSTRSSGIVNADGLVAMAAGTPASTTMFTAWYNFVPSFPSSAVASPGWGAAAKHVELRRSNRVPQTQILECPRAVTTSVMPVNLSTTRGKPDIVYNRTTIYVTHVFLKTKEITPARDAPLVSPGTSDTEAEIR